MAELIEGLTSLSKEEQLALISQLEQSIMAREAEDEAILLEQAAEDIANRIVELEDFVETKVKELTEIAKTPGPAGKDGKAGRDGRDGLDGQSIVGPRGLDGKDGQDGADGQDGRSIVDVYWAADGSLVCVLSDGTEIDTGPLIGGNDGGNINATVNQWAGYSSEELKQTLVGKTFETVNKNLEASAGTLAYNVGGDLLTITYDNGVVKTLAYDANSDLESVTLSGNTPEGINLVKTFSYNISGDLISFTYS